jgi:hypothetical protein
MKLSILSDKKCAASHAAIGFGEKHITENTEKQKRIFLFDN